MKYKFIQKTNNNLTNNNTVIAHVSRVGNTLRGIINK